MTKVKFNPSTGKMSWDADTSKVQVSIPAGEIPTECQWCDTSQPESLTISLSDFVDIACCDGTCGAGSPFSWKPVGIDDSVNGLELEIPHTAGCIYSDSFSDSFGKYQQHYPCTDCSTGCTHIANDWWFNFPFSRLDASLTLTETGINITINIFSDLNDGSFCDDSASPNNTDVLANLFSGSITYAEGENCGNTEETASNDIMDCVICNIYPHTLCPCPSSGVVSVTVT